MNVTGSLGYGIVEERASWRTNHLIDSNDWINGLCPSHSVFHVPLQVKALCSWTAKAEGHLSFSQGDLIAVLQRQENWWLGELNGTQGWFPKSYVGTAVAGEAAPE